MASVNAVPSGWPVRQRAENHRPDAEGLPGIVIVGDYLFELDPERRDGFGRRGHGFNPRRLAPTALRRGSDKQWRNQGAALVQSRRDRVCAGAIFSGRGSCRHDRDRLGFAARGQILHVGSASGRTVQGLRALGFDAFGVESNRLAHVATPPTVGHHNRQCELTDLPFADQEFDLVIETGLCRLTRPDALRAIEEIRRVSKGGMVLGSVTTDLSIDLIERHNLLEGVRMLGFDGIGRKSSTPPASSMR